MATYNGTSGDDTFGYSSSDGIQVGDVINGFEGRDKLILNALGSTEGYDISVVTLNSVEVLDYTGSGKLVKLTAQQLDNFVSVNATNFQLMTGGTVSMSGAAILLRGTYTLANAATTLDFTGATNFNPNDFYPAGFIIRGGTGNDVITTLDAADQIQSGGGDDVVYAGGGDDTVYGGAGRDEIHGGAGKDQFMLSEGDLTAGEIYDGGDGVDSLRMASNATTVDLTAVTLMNLESLDFYNTNFSCVARLRLDQFAGLTWFGGNDSLVVNIVTGGAVAISGGLTGTFNLAAASTTFDMSNSVASSPKLVINGNSGDDVIIAGAASTVISGGTGRDVLKGGAGDDRIIVGSGDVVAGEVYDGGGGVDRLEVTGSLDISSATIANIETLVVDVFTTTSITAAQLQNFSRIESRLSVQSRIALTTGGETSYGGTAPNLMITFAAADTVLNLAGFAAGMQSSLGVVVVGNIGNDRIVGSRHADTLDGGSGNDVMAGGDGRDRIDGAEGNDVLIGGLGADALVGGAGIDTASYEDNAGAVSLDLRTGRGYTNAAFDDTYSGIENVIGSSFGDYLIGGYDANRIDGAGGDDVLVGSLGADVLVGGEGIDFASYEDNQGAVFIDLYGNGGYGNAAQGDTYVGIENLRGSIFNDYLMGDGGINRLEGIAGDDVLIGGLGADVLVGGDGSDTVSYEENWGMVTADLSQGRGYGNAAQGDTYVGIENARGGMFEDTLLGNAGANRLSGLRGADTLAGYDGADTFVFDSILEAGNVDTILDFASGSDRIELKASMFAGLSAGTLSAAAFTTGTAATDAAHRIVYDSASGQLFYDADGSGAGAAVLFAVLSTKPAIVAADFMVVA